MTTQNTATSTRFSTNLSTARLILEHGPIVTSLPSLGSDRGTSLVVNNISVALKCPMTERDNICLELLHETISGNWAESWFATCQAQAYLWVLPEGRHLWVRRVNLVYYDKHQTASIPLTNHSTTTQRLLAIQGAPCNVVTKWVPIDDVIDKTKALCYNVEDYNPHNLQAWLHDNFAAYAPA